MHKHLMHTYDYANATDNFMEGNQMRFGLYGCALASVMAWPAYGDSASNTSTASNTATLPSWNYIGGANNDEGWGELSPQYAVCSLGTAQSPVAIGETTASMMSPLRVSYARSSVIAQLREHTLVLQFNNDANHISHEGTRYFLKQIRMHSPSEHDISGKTYPMEWHLIHQSRDGAVMIVAVLIDIGAASPSADGLLAHLPSKDVRETQLFLNPADFITDSTRYYAYSGSLTWPPCTEGVQWRILKDPMLFSKEQLVKLSALLGRNARLLQPLYFRDIKATMN